MDNVLSSEVEEAITKSVNTPSEPTKEDLAARDYQMLLPKFEQKLYPMSRRQQQRVIMALLKYPLEDDKPRFSYPEEQEAFYLGMQIQDCKLIIMNAVLELMKDSDKMKQLNQELEELKRKQEANDQATEVVAQG